MEQAPFNPANIIPVIGLSPDKMLQGRLFSYGDAQGYRLGLIPVNKSKCSFLNMFRRDGLVRTDVNCGATPGYESNSYGEWQELAEHKEPPLEIDGGVDRWDHREDDDYYSQTGDVFRLMNKSQHRFCLKIQPGLWVMHLNIKLKSKDIENRKCPTATKWMSETINF